jgi:oligoendopeptidase F
MKTRTEASQEDKWNIDALYPSIDKWQEDFNASYQTNQQPHWPKLAAFKGKLGESPATLKSALETLLSIDRQLAKLYTYAHLRHDEDIADEKNKIAFNQILSVYHEFSQEIAWFDPELMTLSDETIKAFLASSELKDYRFHLEKIFRLKKHTLSPEKEELIALAGKAFQAPHKAFGAINDADFKFGKINNEKGEELELTHATYGIYLREYDRKLRENAFNTLHQKYLDYENTLSELINGAIQSYVFNARARGYSSTLEAALYPKNIDTSVYHSLIQAVTEEMSALHRYIDLRKKMLNVGTLHLYDMYVPLTQDIDISLSYPEAEEIIIESVSPLGPQYQNALKEGLQKNRWVDRYENRNKKSGAYSGGCYDSMPYILMNYKGILRDTFTLAHEAGHSMHSLLTHQNQPYQYGDYSIFLAEVASTFNEDLLMRKLLERCRNPQEKIYLINQKIEDIRATFFRQTMFAEFELFLHTSAEKNIPLTPNFLKEEYRRLNQKYFGPDVEIDETALIEWARIGHFYYNFYVFQYATGISAALALTDRVISGGKSEQADYLAFLKGGSSRYPIEMLQIAGIDMRKPAPVKAAIQKFSFLVDELEKLL